MMKDAVNVMWFRRDLRLHDNAALYSALKSGGPVLPVFIFDKYILDDLEDKIDRRVEFIHTALEDLQKQLVKLDSSLHVFYGKPLEVFKQLLKKYDVAKVFTNTDYEQYAIERDKAVENLLAEQGAAFHTYKDQVIFEKNEVLKDDGESYTIFSPYSRKWKAMLNDFYLQSYPVEKYFSNFYKQPKVPIPSLESIGFKATKEPFPSKDLEDELMKNYGKTRNFPSLKSGTSRIGVHLRFGTVSIRELARKALALNETYLNELIWREFYHMILWHYPHIGKGKAFKKKYDNIRWRNDVKEFKAWCEGKTGYPIVDAGMRQLNSTGYMHNRVRMITASFLTKHLLTDWRWGEAYFAQKLLDFDFAANNGGWQWAAGSGCDAAPYFRIFNPTLQTKKFDKNLEYIKEWVPELNSFEYPKPIVDHALARNRALEAYGKEVKL